MQTTTSANASLKIATKGSKQMNQFRYGPVRAVQQPMPHSFSSGINNMQKNNNQRRVGGALVQNKNNLLMGNS